MSGPILNSSETLFKEVYIRKSPEDWNEITLNAGGIASTLQDVKTRQKSGAYVYEKIPNRFIYWRTEHSVLELVEESLDVSLHGNQLRYKFVDTQVLDGLSVTETLNSLIILVPTLSSLHVFTYPHPGKLVKKGFNEISALSIFHGTNENVAADPRTFHHLNCSSNVIVSCSSVVAQSGEAIFALSLANSTVLLVSINPLSGSTSSRLLSHDTLIPRFLSGITDALRGKEGGEWVGVSLKMHCLKKELFLFSVCRGGGLRIWSVDRAAHILSTYLKSLPGQIKGQKHKLAKGCLNGSLVLHVCIQGCAIVTLLPEYDDGAINLTTISEIPIVQGMEAMDMCPGEEGQLWCNWLTTDESSAITKNSVIHPGQAAVALTRPMLTVNPSKYIPLDPASHYLNAIFSSGFFTATDIAKALGIYKITAVVKPNVDTTEQICSIVDTEIFSEIGIDEIGDDEFFDIAHRCWSRLYGCCSQYIMSSMMPLGMARLDNAVLLIQESGFSIVVDIEPLELFLKTTAEASEYPDITYGWLIERVRDVNLDEGIEKVNLSLLTGESVDDLAVIQNAADLIPPSELLENALSIFQEEQLEDSMNTLIEDLALPENFSKEDFAKDGCWESLCSYSGIGAVTSAFRDFVSVRLSICQKLLLLSEIFMRNGSEIAERHQQKSLSALCKAYYILRWVCTTKSIGDAPLIHVFALANQTHIAQSSLRASVIALANCLWPLASNNILPQYLLATKQYALLQTYSRIIGANTWSLLLAESYIITGESGKAFDICLKSAGSDVMHFLNAIKLFERHCRSDLVTAMATKALLNVSQSERETLESALFVHELGLGNYDAAWSWIESCSSWSRRSDFLHRLVSNMISEGKLTDLISFPYTGLIDELEKFLASRARSLPLSHSSNYYNILYAFHVKHENFKKAASVMLEKGLRADTTEMQWRCFGASLSALMLVPDPLHAWLVRPNPLSTEDSIDILEIEHLQREFQLAEARYTLEDCLPDTTQEEVIAFCVTQKQYKLALRLANMCKLSCAPIIQAFTSSCAALCEQSITWHWLKNNELDDILLTDQNAVYVSWRVLERCIIKYERGHETLLHRACANHLLVIGYPLPTWLLRSYKKRNSSEMLRMYVEHGYLDEASDLACDYLNAALGVGREDFAVEAPLGQSCPIRLPLELIDLLLLELKHHNISEQLEKTLNKYVATSTRLSEEMCSTVFEKR